MFGLFKQEENGSRHVLRIKDVAGHPGHCRLALFDGTQVLAGQVARDQVGVDQARLDRAHSNPTARHLSPQATTQTLQEMLGAAVDCAPCASCHTTDARHVDDVAALLLHHAWQHSCNAVEAAADVDVDHLVPAVLVRVDHVLPHG